MLGFESSCDETGVALCTTDGRILGQALYSQIAMHKDYGGVVPELASRDHIRRLIPLMDETFEQAGIALQDVDAIAVTTGPGLPGALMAGCAFCLQPGDGFELACNSCAPPGGALAVTFAFFEPTCLSFHRAVGQWRAHATDGCGRPGTLRPAG